MIHLIPEFTVYHFMCKGTPVLAIEEGNQLSLNNNELNFYALPHTLTLTASPRETELFIENGHNPQNIKTVGLNKYSDKPESFNSKETCKELGVHKDKNIILYATSPLQRLIDHSFESWGIDVTF